MRKIQVFGSFNWHWVKWKFNSSVTLARFQVLKSHTGPAATVLDSVDGEYLYCGRKFYWMVLSRHTWQTQRAQASKVGQAWHRRSALGTPSFPGLHHLLSFIALFSTSFFLSTYELGQDVSKLPGNTSFPFPWMVGERSTQFQRFRGVSQSHLVLILTLHANFASCATTG